MAFVYSALTSAQNASVMVIKSLSFRRHGLAQISGLIDLDRTD